MFLIPTGVIDFVDEPMLGVAAGAYGLTQDDLAVYRGNRPGASPGDLMAAVITDWFFRIPAILVAGVRATPGTASTWVYRFDYPEPQANNGLGAGLLSDRVDVVDDPAGDERARWDGIR